MKHQKKMKIKDIWLRITAILVILFLGTAFLPITAQAATNINLDKYWNMTKEGKFNYSYTDKYGVERKVALTRIRELWYKDGDGRLYFYAYDNITISENDLPKNVPDDYVVHKDLGQVYMTSMEVTAYPDFPKMEVYEAMNYPDGTIDVAYDYRDKYSNHKDDYGNSRNVAYTISIGSYPGSIQYAKDEDYFQFKPSASGTYQFKSSGSTNVKGALNASDGKRLAVDSSSAGKGNFEIKYRLTAGKYYYLKISGEKEKTTGKYTLTVLPVGTGKDDYGNSFALAYPKGYGTSTGKLNKSGDVDFISYKAAITHTYTFTLSSSVKVKVIVYDKDGKKVAATDTAVKKSGQVELRLTKGSIYYFRVQGIKPSAVGGYSIKVLTKDTIGNNLEKAYAVKTKTVTSYLDTNVDKDVFALTPAATGRYTMSLKGTAGMKLEFYSTDKKLVKKVVLSAKESKSSFAIRLAKGKTYYLCISGGKSSPAAYTLGVK